MSANATITLVELMAGAGGYLLGGIHGAIEGAGGFQGKAVPDAFMRTGTAGPVTMPGSLAVGGALRRAVP